MEEILEPVYERKINYYETDGMGIVHHSNYIRYLEEARCYWLDQYDMSYSAFEKEGINIPVLAVNCEYKHHVAFDDTIQIKVFIKKYNGVRMTIGYDVRDKNNGKLVIMAETKHCFTDKNLRAVNLKKHLPEFDEKFRDLENRY